MDETTARGRTVAPISLPPDLHGRERLSEVRRAGSVQAAARLVVQPEGSPCHPIVRREPTAYVRPWTPIKGRFVWCDNGWGTRSRAEIRGVGNGQVREFGVSFVAHTANPLHWLKMSEMGKTWEPEA